MVGPTIPAEKNGLLEEDGNFFLGLSLIFTLVGSGLLFWRVKRIWHLLRVGVELPAEITRIWFSRDRGWVTYRYEYQGQTYTSGQILHRTAQTKALQKGMPVPVLVNPEAPRKALLKALYLPEG